MQHFKIIVFRMDNRLITLNGVKNENKKLIYRKLQKV